MTAASLFGILGVIANTLWPLFKTRRNILLGQIAACITMGFHYFYLDALTASAVVTVAGVQAALAIPLDNHPRFKSIYLLSTLCIPLICWLTWQGLPSIFSALALTFFCIGNYQTNILKMRALLLMCIFAWIVHNVMITSYPGLTSNGLSLMTSGYALWILWKLSIEKADLEKSVGQLSSNNTNPAEQIKSA